MQIKFLIFFPSAHHEIFVCEKQFHSQNFPSALKENNSQINIQIQNNRIELT